MKQTAVEWFQEQIIKIVNGTCELSEIQIFEQAKEMEKEQIFKALIRGHNDCGVFTMQSECEEYYEETFNK
jgi:hypothetical protein